MKTLLAFAILLLVGFLGSVKLFNKIKVSSPLEYLFYSGTVYILLGLFIGENGLNLLNPAITNHLAPVFNFSLGWVGFIFGFQLEFRYLRRAPPSSYFALVFTYFSTFITIFLIAFIAYRYFFTSTAIPTIHRFGLAFVIAILIPESSVSFINWSSRFFKKAESQIHLARFISSLDNFFPIFFTGLMMSLYSFLLPSRDIVLNGLKPLLFRISLQIVIGALAAFLLHLILTKIRERLEVSTILFGVIFLTSGLSMMAGVSPLFVAMTAGMILSNTIRRHADIQKILIPTEKPIFIIFLIFLSIKKAELSFFTIFISLIFLLFKYLSKLASLKLLKRHRPDLFSGTAFISLLLVPVSSIAAVIMLDLIFAYPHPYTGLASGVLIVTMIASELIAPAIIKLAQRRMKGKQ